MFEKDLIFCLQRGSSKPQLIRQFHFQAWPDKNIPDNAWCFVDFWRTIDTEAVSVAGPIVVHCRYIFYVC